MAKKKSKTVKQQNAAATTAATKKKVEERVTMQALEEMSDSDDDDDGPIPESQWSAKAKNLRKEIEDGKFDKLIGALKRASGKDDEFEEDTLDSSSEGDDDDNNDEDDDAGVEQPNDEMESEAHDDDDDDDDDNDGEEDEDGEGEPNDSGSEEEEEKEDDDDDEADAHKDGKEQKSTSALKADDKSDDEDSEEENESNDDDDDEEEDGDEGGKSEKAQRLQQNNVFNSKALAIVTADLAASHSKLPWAETFHIVPATPLPFGTKGDPEGNPLDIHDDLKREVAFYNSALEAVQEARKRCKEANIPFSRPEDFFAEMVKTDDHMAKVKDRLIFENKKIEAVAQRKSNREQKLRAKESRTNKLAEKAKRKREHFQEVEEWANSAARNRGGALRDDADEMFLRGNKGPNKKRQAADRKYGFGGKKGHFKQNDKATINDVSGFNPRGNFPGMGTKKSAKSKSGSGADRAGKRAREAKRARR